MKKLIALILSLTFVLALVGCNQAITQGKDGNNPPIDGWETTVSYANWSDDSSISFGALNKDKMTINSVQHLPIFKMDTKEELEQFKTFYGKILSMNQSYDEVPSFESATFKYDEVFFEQNSLLIVYVSASSGSERFDVNNVYCDAKSVCVHVEQTNNPEIGTADMAGWFITIAIQDSTIRDCESFDADLNNTEN